MITNKTIQAAIRLGFDFSNCDLSENLDKQIIDFLHENSDKIKIVSNEFCEVSGHGNSQYVSYGDFSSSGNIVQWADYYGKRKQRIYHSDFFRLREDGTPILIKLYCYSK